MKKATFLAILFLASVSVLGQATIEDRSYFTSGTELIFQFATIDNNGVEGGNVMRFSGWLHLQGLYHRDFGKAFGIITGLALRNVGFIYEEPETGAKWKFRNYNVGIPVGFKLGNMSKMYLYTGYEIEFPVNFKQKKFVNERLEDKFNVWFSDRTPAFYNTLFLGVKFKYGLDLKFKYYLTGFFNQDYSEINNDGITEYPYQGLDVQIFYVSLNINLFRDAHFRYSRKEINKNY
jgi:hypothetical protein